MFYPSLESLHADLPTVITTIIYPGPLLAKFSDAWLAYVAYQGYRSEVVHNLHRQYGLFTLGSVHSRQWLIVIPQGPFVRLAPNHISVALSDALPVVYGHGHGTLKSSFYDVFASTSPGLFDTRDRKTHTRKRKIISHTFSQKSVLEFEPHVRSYVSQLLGHWDKLYDKSLKGMSGKEGNGWTGRNGRLWLDCFPWANYLTFDIIADLAFGAPFGMIMAGKDSALVPKDQHTAMDSYGKVGTNYATKEVAVIKTVGGASETFPVTMGAVPGWWRTLLGRSPFLREGGEDFKAIAGLAIVAVSKRLEVPTDKNDLLNKLQAARDEDGNPMCKEELTAEAVTLLAAGGDTTAKQVLFFSMSTVHKLNYLLSTTSAIIYYLARSQSVQEKLQKELDEHLDSDVATVEQVKGHSYLQAVINEGLRVYSTLAMGLPREAPEGGIMILGNYFPGGTIISVPTYTINRDPTVFGDDVEEFRPERWLEPGSAAMLKVFSPFSVGPRGCIGRNLANMELQLIIGSILRHFHFVLENPDEIFEVHEGFVRKPVTCRVGMRRREVL
ncbi:cytochrome P450 monooxygenase [Desarmillaria tabescens]|uniref:Cytochrome P450 monooxygenase n=1 Tax=Armillaria tabescens TaxID=1929756 RepID=A0AA39NJW0_ARMTA|nr:cytochrome P450 monooxygenase [Desarmillaria tabescens]KAK0466879.1 cytochrome P450 monooxygenase [Desarmillaria tabescens]